MSGAGMPISFRKWPNQCKFCDRVFDRPSRLRKHLVVHETLEKEGKSNKPEKFHCCEECSYKTKRRFSLQLHMRTHTGEKFHCEPCNKAFKQKRTLLVHMRRDHTGERPYTCNFCNETFFATYTLRSHIEKNHTEGPVKRKPHRYHCPQCSYSTDRKHRLETHVQNHSVARPFGCDLCEKTFRKRHHLMGHLRVYHKGERPFACTTCGQKFAASISLHYHEKRHTKEATNKTGTKNSSPRKMAEPKHRCPQCFYTTRRKSSLLSHMRTHQGKCGYKCELCNKIFSQKGTVMGHLRRMHKMMNLYCCPSCDKIMYSMSALNNHIESQHHEDFQHACASCDRRYTSVFSLRSHINRDHSKEFEHECTYCQQRFRTPQGLHRHIKSRHFDREEKPEDQ